jgi:hypothetical protein
MEMQFMLQVREWRLWKKFWRHHSWPQLLRDSGALKAWDIKPTKDVDTRIKRHKQNGTRPTKGQGQDKAATNEDKKNNTKYGYTIKQNKSQNKSQD